MAQQTISIHPVLSRIRTRGYWRTIIRPAQFEPERIADLATLTHLVAYSATHLRGWDFPALPRAGNEERGSDWVEYGVDTPARPEYWRFYQSGQLLHYAGISEDWNTLSYRWHRHPAEESVALLPVFDSLYRLTEIFQFAANLGLARDYNAGSSLHIEIQLLSLEGRQLYNDAAPERRIYLTGVRPVGAGDFSRSLDIPLSELVANSREFALQTAERLFHRCYWQATPGLIRSIQDEFTER